MGAFTIPGGAAGYAQKRGYGVPVGPTAKYGQSRGYGALRSTTGGGSAGGGITGEYEAARAANEARYAEAMSIYDEIIGRYARGGAFEKSALGEIERQKIKGVGEETQSLISGGMYGTTTAGGVGRKWEADVGAPARLRLEDVMEQRLVGAKREKAGFIERREDVYPDVGSYAQYMGQAAQAGGGGSAGGGGMTISGTTGATQKWGSYGVGTPTGTPTKTRKPGAGYYGNY